MSRETNINFDYLQRYNPNRYMCAPEKLRTKSEVDERVEVWA